MNIIMFTSNNRFNQNDGKKSIIIQESGKYNLNWFIIYATIG